MEIIEKAQKMLEKYPLCNHCLGRQFALLGHGLENQTRGEAVKLLLTMRAHQMTLTEGKVGVALLNTLATNGAFSIATQILRAQKKRVGKVKQCYLCEGRKDQRG